MKTSNPAALHNIREMSSFADTDIDTVADLNQSIGRKGKSLNRLQMAKVKRDTKSAMHG